MKKNIKILFLTFFLISCQKNVEFSEYISFSNGWKKGEPATFLLSENDSLTKKNIFIMVRNNQQYDFRNLFIITKLETPNRQIITDTLEYEMASAQGKWLGYGFSSVKESKLFYKENFNFPAKGNYVLKIEQAMRKVGQNEGVEVLDGITEIGLMIEKSSL